MPTHWATIVMGPLCRVLNRPREEYNFVLFSQSRPTAYVQWEIESYAVHRVLQLALIVCFGNRTHHIAVTYVLLCQPNRRIIVQLLQYSDFVHGTAASTSFLGFRSSPAIWPSQDLLPGLLNAYWSAVMMLLFWRITGPLYKCNRVPLHQASMTKSQSLKMRWNSCCYYTVKCSISRIKTYITQKIIILTKMTHINGCGSRYIGNWHYIIIMSAFSRLAVW